MQSQCTKGIITKTNRITEIDALRCAALLGILLVHTGNRFGWPNFNFFSSFDNKLILGISYTLSNRCNSIFNILFGCSFWFILKKPEYPALKFVWRCFILMTIGLFAKVFYTYDALMWYGLWGMVLTIFRNLNCKQLLVSSILFYLLSSVLTSCNLGHFLFTSDIPSRYTENSTLISVISYPLWKSIIVYLIIVLNRGIFKTLSFMLIGYYFAKKGIVLNLRKYCTLKILAYFGTAYMVLFFGFYILKHYGIAISQIPGFSNIAGSFTYSIIFILFYQRFSKHLLWMEKYGRLGLTNYLGQSIVGVTIISTIIIPLRISFVPYAFIMLLFFAIQSIFAVKWLEHHKYGPLETLWRNITDLYNKIL